MKKLEEIMEEAIECLDAYSGGDSETLDYLRKLKTFSQEDLDIAIEAIEEYSGGDSETLTFLKKV
jgi:hypothetical protein